MPPVTRSAQLGGWCCMDTPKVTHVCTQRKPIPMPPGGRSCKQHLFLASFGLKMGAKSVNLHSGLLLCKVAFLALVCQFELAVCQCFGSLDQGTRGQIKWGACTSSAQPSTARITHNCCYSCSWSTEQMEGSPEVPRSQLLFHFFKYHQTDVFTIVGQRFSLISLCAQQARHTGRLQVLPNILTSTEGGVGVVLF